MSDGKWIAGLRPDMPVADAARAVLAARLEVVRHFLPLAAERPFEDSEYVHQLRVGTRRAGAALEVFADCLPRKRLKAVKRSLRAIRRAAGDARDWDVFIQALSGAKPLNTAKGKPARDFLLGYALGERSAAQARLVEATADAGPGFADESLALPEHAHEPHGGSPPPAFGAAAVAYLDDLFADFTASVRADPTEPADLHRLRIRAKQLRYAIELFANCFAPALREHVYPAVEALQEQLGGLQDAAVGVERLERVRARAQKVVPGEWPRLRDGIAGLIRGLRTRLKAGRKKFVAWRAGWEKLSAEHPLAALRLAPDAAGPPVVEAVPPADYGRGPTGGKISAGGGSVSDGG
jgi:CHAD domain-containing protein